VKRRSVFPLNINTKEQAIQAIKNSNDPPQMALGAAWMAKNENDYSYIRTLLGYKDVKVVLEAIKVVPYLPKYLASYEELRILLEPFYSLRNTDIDTLLNAILVKRARKFQEPNTQATGDRLGVYKLNHRGKIVRVK
jgi:hypothetical protein